METKKNCSTISCMRRNDQQQHHRKTFVVEIWVTVVTVTPFSLWVKLTFVKQRHFLLGNNGKGLNASVLNKHNELCLKNEYIISQTVFSPQQKTLLYCCSALINPNLITPKIPPVFPQTLILEFDCGFILIDSITSSKCSRRL